MPDEVRVNRPSQPSMAGRQDMSMQGEAQAMQRSSKMPWVILAVVVVIIVVLALLFRNQLFGGSNGTAMMSASSSAADASGYEAVFLTNGQVYFGKISDSNANYITLKDIFYLQVGPQQGSGTAASNSPQSISLVKLGNELHGPVDEMHISRYQVLFYEDLKTSGQVVQAIKNYKANPSGTAPTPTPAK